MPWTHGASCVQLGIDAARIRVCISGSSSPKCGSPQDPGNRRRCHSSSNSPKFGRFRYILIPWIGESLSDDAAGEKTIMPIAIDNAALRAAIDMLMAYSGADYGGIKELPDTCYASQRDAGGVSESYSHRSTLGSVPIYDCGVVV